ncbi:hypothetical protein PDIDSM_5641 [Penicillium digitatum]|nr:hypothetical protein PDIDSM_5641 [Penicillium digitatum]
MLMFEETTPGARSWPLTPPNSSDPPAPKDVSSVVTAIHVISTERAALAHLEHIYQTDARAQHDLARAVDQIARSVREGGKLVVCGVGKSGKVGRKIEATMNSLGVYSAFLHPTEALHGDLGLVRPNDTVLLISFSGRSPELLSLLPHLPGTVPVIALTSHTHPVSCPLLALHGPSGMGILLPAPIHEDERSSFGPLLRPGNCTLDREEPCRGLSGVPSGGAIGAATAAAETPLTSPRATWSPAEQRPISRDMLVPLDHIPTASASSSQSPGDVRLLDILLTAIQHPHAKSWVMLSPSEIIPSRRIRALLSPGGDMDLRVSEVIAKDPGTPFVIPQSKWLLVTESTPLAEIRRTVSESRNRSDPVSVVAVVKDRASPGGIIGVTDAEDLLDG